MSRRRSKKAVPLSPLLVRLIEAAERSKQDAEGGDIRGVPQALRELGDLATWMLPVHGLFVPNNNEVCMAVDRVARQHLDLEEARQELKEALSVVADSHSGIRSSLQSTTCAPRPRRRTSTPASPSG